MSGSLPLRYQIELCRVNLGRISCSWGMPLYSENNPRTTRSPSPTSTASQVDDNYDEELWEQLDAAFRTQEANFMIEEYIDNVVPLNGLDFTSDTLGIPKAQSPTALNLPPQGQLAGPDFGSESPSPSIPSSSRPLVYPLLPVRPPELDFQSEHPASPSCPQADLPSQCVQVDNSSTAVEITRTSPTGRFIACGDQIRDLINRGAWVHGAVINTLGDLFCYGSRSQCRAWRYEILPSWLFECWNNSTKDQTAAQDCRRAHSDSFKKVASPVECRAWLVPVLLESHWYLLSLDWMDHRVRIYDSLATRNEPPPSQLEDFGIDLVKYADQDFDLGDQSWGIIAEQVRILI